MYLRESTTCRYNYAGTHPGSPRRTPDKARQFVTEFAAVDDKTAEKMILPTWVDSVDPAKVQQLVDIMHEYGATKKPIDIAPYLLEFPLPE